MFLVVYMNDQTRQSVLQAGPFKTLDAARESRKVSGDLVVDEKGKIVEDLSWLWDCERKDAVSYAHQCILRKIQVREILKYVPGNKKTVWDTGKLERVWAMTPLSQRP